MTLYIRSVRGDEGDPGDDLAEGWTLAHWINSEIRERFPGHITIAEDLRNNAAMTSPEGAGFGAQWDSQFVHPIREALIAMDDAERHMGTVAHAIRHHYNGDPFQRVDESAKLVAFHRWEAGGPGDDVVVVANFSHEAREVYRIGFPRPGLWKLRLNSDWAGYSEDFADFPSHDVEAVEQDCDGMKWSAEVSVGGYTALVFSQDP